MRRFATFTLLSLVLGLTGPALLRAQDDAKKDEKPAETKKDEAAKPAEKKDEAAKPAETKKDEAAKPAEKKDETAKPAETKPAETKPEEKDAPLAPIPPEVEAKLEKARRAVAEAIVAAQDAGLVETTVNPPPILDILVTGRAIDARQIKKHTGVSTEVFGAWFTGFGKLENFTAQKDVRIVNPSEGLLELYTQRANVLDRHIKAVRDAKAAEKKEEPKKEEPKAEEPKKDEAKKEEPKKDEAKKEEPKAEEPKKDEAKKEEPKAEEPKKEEPKAEEPKKD